jgi:hypothetical protein
MPEPRVLLCGPALDLAESAASLEMLRGIAIPGAEKFVVTTGKFDTQKDARAFNVEADYPAQTAYMQTLARWAEVPEWPDRRFRDGYDLYCLQRILAANDRFDIAVLIRDGGNFSEHWPQLLEKLADSYFLVFGAEGGPAGLVLNLQKEGVGAFLDYGLQIFSTGRSYAIEPYDLDRVLKLAHGALDFGDALSRSLEVAGGERALG